MKNVLDKGYNSNNSPKNSDSILLVVSILQFSHENKLYSRAIKFTI